MVDTLQQESIICSSPVRSVNGNADIDYGGGGSDPARARSYRDIDWDDWDE